jgi:hypothetical protein
MNKVIMRGEFGESDTKRVTPQAAVNVTPAIVPPFAAFGLVLLAVGVVDLGLAWWPLQLGSGEWEFGTASRTFNSLALGSTGFVFLVVAASAQGWVFGLRVLAGLSVLGVLLLLGALTLFGLNVPVALGAISEQARPTLVRAIGRTTVFAVLYIGLFGWLSWFTWRRAGAAGTGAPR